MEALSVVANQKDSTEESSGTDIKYRGIVYLIDCYERVSTEECTKVRDFIFGMRCARVSRLLILYIALQKNKSPPRSTVLSEIKQQAIQYTTMLLMDTLQFELSDIGGMTTTSPENLPFLQVMMKRTLPRGFLADLICYVNENPCSFSKVRLLLIRNNCVLLLIFF